MLLFDASVEAESRRCKKAALFLFKKKKGGVGFVWIFLVYLLFLVQLWRLHQAAADDFTFLDVCHK